MSSGGSASNAHQRLVDLEEQLASLQQILCLQYQNACDFLDHRRGSVHQLQADVSCICDENSQLRARFHATSPSEKSEERELAIVDVAASSSDRAHSQMIADVARFRGAHSQATAQPSGGSVALTRAAASDVLGEVLSEQLESFRNSLRCDIQEQLRLIWEPASSANQTSTTGQSCQASSTDRQLTMGHGDRADRRANMASSVSKLQTAAVKYVQDPEPEDEAPSFEAIVPAGPAVSTSLSLPGMPGSIPGAGTGSHPGFENTQSSNATRIAAAKVAAKERGTYRSQMSCGSEGVTTNLSLSSGRNKLGKNHTKSAVHNLFDQSQDQMKKPSLRSAEDAQTGQGWQEMMDYFVAVCIILNGIFIGVQTDYMAQYSTEEVPEVFIVFETLFMIIFTFELVVRIARHRFHFLYMTGWQWNYFDSFLVLLQLMDIFVALFIRFDSAQSSMDTAKNMKNLGFLRLLRILRILRIFRLVRLLAFFGELNVVTSAIAGSMKSLFGTVILLLLLMYIVGVILTQIATSHRLNLGPADPEADLLQLWWGTLGRTILSLYEAILGGVDWDDVITPLMEIHIMLGGVFAAYIAFTLLAMMNVITGIFVESALKNAERMKDASFMSHVRSLYKAADVDNDGTISKVEFETCMGDPAVQVYMEQLGINMADARYLFHVLDDDQSGTIDSEELLNGLIRLKAGAKFTDIMTILQEIQDNSEERSNFQTLALNWMKSISQHVEGLDQRLQGVSASKPAPNRGRLAVRRSQ